uniref:Uncharacterized protein n=1 Tax=Nothobranchius furzeri TaxID=105023 RepID=A0A8C6LXA8_NOTFU
GALTEARLPSTGATAMIAIEKTTVDVGIIIEGMVILQDLDNVALATAMLFGLFKSLNMTYPSQLRYTFEVLQMAVMELHATQLSRKAQNLNTKIM